MIDADFPDELRSFIQENIPSVDAAELLVVLARQGERSYDVHDAVEATQPSALSEQDARRYLAHFQSRGIVSSPSTDTYRYAPATAELAKTVSDLMRVFNQRPVTLVRVIYAGRDEKLRSLADAFRIKK